MCSDLQVPILSMWSNTVLFLCTASAFQCKFEIIKYIFFMSPCSVLSGGQIFTALISLTVLGVHRALSRWETRWMASRAQHRPVILTETCCRDVVRLRSGRISVGKDTDRVWKDPRAGSHEVSRHTEYPLRPAVFLPGAAPAHYWGLCSHRGTLCPRVPEGEPHCLHS